MVETDLTQPMKAKILVILAGSIFAVAEAQYVPNTPAVATALTAAEAPDKPGAPAHFRSPRATYERAVNMLAAGEFSDYLECFTPEGRAAEFDGEEPSPEELQIMKQEFLNQGFTSPKIMAFSHQVAGDKVTITTEISSVRDGRRFKEAGTMILKDTPGGWKIEAFDLNSAGNVPEP